MKSISAPKKTVEIAKGNVKDISVSATACRGNGNGNNIGKGNGNGDANPFKDKPEKAMHSSKIEADGKLSVKAAENAKNAGKIVAAVNGKQLNINAVEFVPRFKRNNEGVQELNLTELKRHFESMDMGKKNEVPIMISAAVLEQGLISQQQQIQQQQQQQLRENNNLISMMPWKNFPKIRDYPKNVEPFKTLQDPRPIRDSAFQYVNGGGSYGGIGSDYTRFCTPGRNNMSNNYRPIRNKSFHRNRSLDSTMDADFQALLEKEDEINEKKREMERKTALEALRLAEQRRLRNLVPSEDETKNPDDQNETENLCHITRLPIKFTNEERERVNRARIAKKIRIERALREMQMEKEAMQRVEGWKRFSDGSGPCGQEGNAMQDNSRYNVPPPSPTYSLPSYNKQYEKPMPPLMSTPNWETKGHMHFKKFEEKENYSKLERGMERPFFYNKYEQYNNKFDQHNNKFDQYNNKFDQYNNSQHNKQFFYNNTAYNKNTTSPQAQPLPLPQQQYLKMPNNTSDDQGPLQATQRQITYKNEDDKTNMIFGYNGRQGGNGAPNTYRKHYSAIYRAQASPSVPTPAPIPSNANKNTNEAAGEPDATASKRIKAEGKTYAEVAGGTGSPGSSNSFKSSALDCNGSQAFPPLKTISTPFVRRSYDDAIDNNNGDGNGGDANLPGKPTPNSEQPNIIRYSMRQLKNLQPKYNEKKKIPLPLISYEFKKFEFLRAH